MINSDKNNILLINIFQKCWPMFRFIFVFFFVYVCLGMFPSSASAAELFFESEVKEVGVIQRFQVDLLINTQDEDINAIEGRIVFPEEQLDLVEIRDGNTIVNFWIEEPQEMLAGRTSFSGIIPGGYVNSRGLLFSMIFLAKEEGAGTVEIQNARVLLNDGLGTEAFFSSPGFQFRILEKISLPSSVPVIQDNMPPEIFIPEIAQDPTIFDNKWFLVFTTQDKGTGVDYYEIKEVESKNIELGQWLRAESPYILKDQNLNSYIYVRAIDKNSNERIALLHPQKPLTKYNNYLTRSIKILGLLFIITIMFYSVKLLYKLYKNKK